MGFDEASAYAQLEMKLEEAIVAGRFAPGHPAGNHGPRR